MQGQKITLIADKDTAFEYKDLQTENGQLLLHLQEKGFLASFQIWDDEKVNWADFDAIVLKSAQDCRKRSDEFSAWLEKLDKIGVFVLNPVDVIQWNSDKIYLKEMGEKGVRIIPTFWFEKGEKFDVEGVFEELKTEKIIIKPRRNAGETYAVTKEEALEKRDFFERLFVENHFMAQPYLKEIETQGEWSFVFLNGKFSHSMIKNFDNEIQRIAAPDNLVEIAQKTVGVFGKGCLYCLVDGLIIEGEFMVMRFEVIEPHLYLLYSEIGMDMYLLGLTELLSENLRK